MPNPRLLAIRERQWDGRRSRIVWRIGTVGPKGSSGKLLGWANPRFRSYKLCVEAIEFAEAGGTAEEWRDKQYQKHCAHRKKD